MDKELLERYKSQVIPVIIEKADEIARLFFYKSYVLINGST